MNCPTCGAPSADNDAFCGKCGASLSAPAPQPTQVMPAQPAAPVAPPVTAPQQAPIAAPAPPPPSGMGAGAAVAITLTVLFVVVGLIVGSYFMWIAFRPDENTTTADSTTIAAPVETPDDGAADPTGFATADEAMADYLPQGWASDILTNNGDIIEYVMGPAASEYENVVIVAQQPDGSWLVEDSYPYIMDTGIDEDPTEIALNSAATVVDSFIAAVMEDRANDAQALTVSPFSEDPASASFANGDLLGYSIVDAQLLGDGTTVEVFSEEDWVWNLEYYIYTCVPTADGYRISELRPQ